MCLMMTLFSESRISISGARSLLLGCGSRSGWFRKESSASLSVPDTVRPMTDPTFDLLDIPVHLGLGTTVE